MVAGKRDGAGNSTALHVESESAARPRLGQLIAQLRHSDSSRPRRRPDRSRPPTREGRPVVEGSERRGMATHRRAFGVATIPLGMEAREAPCTRGRQRGTSGSLRQATNVAGHRRRPPPVGQGREASAPLAEQCDVEAGEARSQASSTGRSTPWNERSRQPNEKGRRTDTASAEPALLEDGSYEDPTWPVAPTMSTPHL